MANLTLAQLSALALVADVTTVSDFPVQVPGLAAPETRKATTLQMQQIALRLTDLTPVLASALSATAMFPVRDAALATAETLADAPVDHGWHAARR